MAADMFLKIDGISGESPDAKHKGEIEIQSFSFGVTQTGTSASGGGGGAGKAHFSDFSFVKQVDKATPPLFLTSATGKHIKEALLTVRKAGGDQQEYYKVKFTDLLISSFQNSGHDGSGVPGESISFNFAKIEFEYKAQKADGSLDGTVKAGYDVKKNEKV